MVDVHRACDLVQAIGNQGAGFAPADALNWAAEIAGGQARAETEAEKPSPRRRPRLKPNGRGLDAPWS